MQENDEELWKECIKGNINTFEIIYCRFYSLLYNYGMKIISDKDIVKDCIQDVFIRLIQRHDKLSPTLYVKGYLLLTFRNKLIETLEKRKSTDDIKLYEEYFSTDDLFQMLFPDNGGLDKKLEWLAAVFRKLPDKQQEILYLYYVKDMKHEDISILLKISYQSSKNLLFRTVNKLRQLYYKK